jgi:hypothetical protein
MPAWAYQATAAGFREFALLIHQFAVHFVFYFFLHFFLRFPAPSLIERKAPWIRKTVLALSTVVVVWNVINLEARIDYSWLYQMAVRFSVLNRIAGLLAFILVPVCALLDFRQYC